jgi:hypothetical protein
MKFIVSWRIAPDQFKAAAQQFLTEPQPAPAGLKILGRWHALGSARGWILAEGDESAMARLLTQASSQLDYDVTPVMTDLEVAELFKDTSFED